MNFFEHARTMYRRRHVSRRAKHEHGLRSFESMCDRTAPRRRHSSRAHTCSMARRRRSFAAPLSFAISETGRR
jgi:hypothetical protein